MTQSFLKDLEEQLVERTEQGVPPRRARHGLLAVAPALAAAAAVIAVVVFVVSGGASPSGSTAGRRSQGRRVVVETTTVTVTRGHGNSSSKSSPTAPKGATAPVAPAIPTPPAGPVPRGFEPQSFTAISETTWWLLGQAPCSNQPCTSIVRTDNGGQSFVGIPAPRSSKVSELRFANAQDGYAYGYGSALWVTHDAGRIWSAVRLGDEIGAVAASGGYVYVIVRSSNGHGRLLRAPVGGGRWTDLPVPEEAWAGLWVQGSQVVLETQRPSASHQHTLVSDNGGASFAVRPIPPNVACTLQAPVSDVLWAECSGGMQSFVARSTNDGGSFKDLPVVGRGALPPQPNSAAFAAATGDVAVDGWERLYRTTDGGASWSRVALPSSEDWTYLGFTDPTHGVAIGEFGKSYRLYYTTDGGASYHLVPIGGS